MFLIASKMILCLVLALLLGIVIGFLLCRMFKECPFGYTSKKEDECCEVREGLKNGIFDAKPQALLKDEVTPDDLKRISGIGEKIEVALNGLGVYTFEQIASWSEENVAWVDEHLVFKGRVKRENWIEQAKILASGKETEFSKRYNS